MQRVGCLHLCSAASPSQPLQRDPWGSCIQAILAPQCLPSLVLPCMVLSAPAKRDAGPLQHLLGWGDMSTGAQMQPWVRVRLSLLRAPELLRYGVTGLYMPPAVQSTLLRLLCPGPPFWFLSGTFQNLESWPPPCQLRACVARPCACARAGGHASGACLGLDGTSLSPAAPMSSSLTDTTREVGLMPSPGPFRAELLLGGAIWAGGCPGLQWNPSQGAQHRDSGLSSRGYPSTCPHP